MPGAQPVLRLGPRQRTRSQTAVRTPIATSRVVVRAPPTTESGRRHPRLGQLRKRATTGATGLDHHRLVVQPRPRVDHQLAQAHVHSRKLGPVPPLRLGDQEDQTDILLALGRTAHQ